MAYQENRTSGSGVSRTKTEFRPCIDIHDGQVKQIVGSTLNDKAAATENFVAAHDAAYYAELYKADGLRGGHVIMLNRKGTPEYEADKAAAFSALKAYPGGLQIGGGIDDTNAAAFLEAGASHVIVTSYVFCNGEICYNRLDKLRSVAGPEHIVLDLSCRRDAEGGYTIVTDRWQKFTDAKLDAGLLGDLSAWCDEFLVHAVDVEGKVSGIEEDVVRIVKESPIPVTYAGGISSIADLERIRTLSDGRVNVTVGSALSLFGGNLDYREVLKCIRSWS
ncbi:MAG: phosphoribosylformimino-5-aminoimidazole carboxamide ribotide isomerase [Lachnospiraceae bacterium]|nr:phosphoribosylformimino-5-aminoimidazole carboxamide ribotide isomerase [Lachnospiraceae bacterium]